MVPNQKTSTTMKNITNGLVYEIGTQPNGEQTTKMRSICTKTKHLCVLYETKVKFLIFENKPDRYLIYTDARSVSAGGNFVIYVY